MNTARNLEPGNTSTSTITKDGAKGLTNLRCLSHIGNFGYDDTNPSNYYGYWLADAKTYNSQYYTYKLSENGNVTTELYNSSGIKTLGLRPVISLKSNITKNNTGDWVIVK